MQQYVCVKVHLLLDKLIHTYSYCKYCNIDWSQQQEEKANGYFVEKTQKVKSGL